MIATLFLMGGVLIGIAISKKLKSNGYIIGFTTGALLAAFLCGIIAASIRKPDRINKAHPAYMKSIKGVDDDRPRP